MPWEKQFDREEVLGRAVRAFWAKGYEATSMEALLGQMGIQKGSFYATFRSKHDVLMEALRHYNKERFNWFEKLARQYPPLEALERHFDEILEESKEKLGCFLMNTALELAPHDKAVKQVVRKTLEAHEGFYQKLLSKAQADGDLPPDYDTRRAATVLIGLLFGMRVLSRAGMPHSAVRTLRDEAVATLRGKPGMPE
jgi:TetR/AcrR family transcriptional repressor of nem operon